MRARHAVVPLLLAVHFGLAVSSVREKSATSDEPVHLATGVAYWTRDHHRLNPEGGIWTQAWAALPVAFTVSTLPEDDHPAWRSTFPGRAVPETFWHDLGGDLDSVLWRARAMTALLGVALGVLVFGWSRRLFGDLGGLLSLAVYAFSPTVLAHARLVTADLGLAAFFLLSVAALWKLMHEIRIGTIAACAASVTGLVLSKMSGVLIVPVAMGLLAVRWAGGRPLRIRWPGGLREHAGPKPAWLLGALAVSAALVWAGVWAAYGFRYSGDPAAETSPYAWSAFRGEGVVPGAISWAADWRLLPEAYLFGFTYTWDQAQGRLAFLDGEVGPGGWPSFFPLAFLYKTPLAVMALALATALRRRGRAPASALYDVAPLLVLLVFYAGVSIAGNLNIGHRHILVMYPAIFVLVGALGPWISIPPRRVWRAALVAGLVAWLAFDAVRIWPHYLAYFNPIAGGPENGYRHLVDSSLDWGQDLPGVEKWLDARDDRDEEVYLAYFGPTRPAHYGIRATLLPGYPHPPVDDLRPRDLGAGVYCISASILQLLWLRTTADPDSPAAERRYAELVALWRAHAATADDAAARERLVADYLARIRARALRRGDADGAALAVLVDTAPRRAWRQQWRRARLELADLQLARLAAALREREPDHQIGHSILVYELEEDDVRRALAPSPRRETWR